MSGTGIFEGKTEEQAREQILSQVREYCDEFHKKKTYKEGDRISYAGRVYDAEEMVKSGQLAFEFLADLRHRKENSFRLATL